MKRSTVIQLFLALGQVSLALALLPVHPHYDVVVVGGSVTGLATAVGLGNTRHKTLILEKAAEFRQIGALIALFPNGITALGALCPALQANVLACCVELQSTVLKNTEDDILKEMPASDSTNSRFLLWYQLQQCLIDSLAAQTTVALNCTFQQVTQDRDNDLCVVHYADHSSSSQPIDKTVTCRVLVGADGINSRVRACITRQARQPAIRFHNRTIYRGILPSNALVGKNISSFAPLGAAVTYRCDTPGKFFKLWNANGEDITFTAAHASTELHDLSDSTANAVLLRKSFKSYGPISELLEKVPPLAIYTNFVCDRDLPDPEHWSNGNIILVGDAAHSMVPALGQGGNVALEDGCELSRLLRLVLSPDRSSSIAVAQALVGFARQRHARIQQIHQASRSQTRNKRGKNQPVPLGEFLVNHPKFQKELYEWKSNVVD